MQKMLLAIFVCLLSFVHSAFAVDLVTSLTVNDFQEVAERQGVPVETLYAIALIETGVELSNNNKVTPYPWAVGIKGVSHYYKTKKEAVLAIRKYLNENGNARQLDVGLMQLNWKWHGDNFSSINEALNPKANLEVAASILKVAMESTNDPIIGVGRYHSWTKHLAYRYGKKVQQLLKQKGESL